MTRPKPPFDRLTRTVGEQGLDSLDIAVGFANLLGITIPDEATPTPLQPERARELTLAAITAWLRHEARKLALLFWSLKTSTGPTPRASRPSTA